MGRGQADRLGPRTGGGQRYRAAIPLVLVAMAVSAPGILAGDLPATETLPLQFRNPARAAISHHRIVAALDPDGARLEVTDEILLHHPPGIPGTHKVPFLLNASLAISEVQITTAATPGAVAWQEHERWDPTAFWDRPEYPAVAGYEHGRQVDLTLSDDSGAGDWPEARSPPINPARTSPVPAVASSDGAR